MIIYGISGLGADKRVFKYLSLDYEFISVDWIKPIKNETIEKYALRLSKKIDTKQPFVILGVSFGGLIAVEISKILKPKLTIIISSAETKDELRQLHKLFGKTNIVKIVPKKAFDIPRKLAKQLFGTNKTELLNSILDDTDLTFTKWAIQQFISWQNVEKLDNCIKISGTKDKLVPPTNNNNTQLIQGGGHFMIVDRAKKISEIINKTVSKI